MGHKRKSGLKKYVHIVFYNTACKIGFVFTTYTPEKYLHKLIVYEL